MRDVGRTEDYGIYPSFTWPWRLWGVIRCSWHGHHYLINPVWEWTADGHYVGPMTCYHCHRRKERAGWTETVKVCWSAFIRRCNCYLIRKLVHGRTVLANFSPCDGPGLVNLPPNDKGILIFGTHIDAAMLPPEKSVGIYVGSRVSSSAS